MRTLLLLVVAVILTGCGNVDIDRTLYVSRDEFNDSQFEVMVRETEKLCEVSEGRHCLVVTREHSSSKVVYVPYIAGATEDTQVFGQEITDHKTGEITILLTDLGLSRIGIGHVFRHELGHAAGCETHIGHGNVLAAAPKYQSETWTAADVDCMDRGLGGK